MRNDCIRPGKISLTNQLKNMLMEIRNQNHASIVSGLPDNMEDAKHAPIV